MLETLDNKQTGQNNNNKNNDTNKGHSSLLFSVCVRACGRACANLFDNASELEQSHIVKTFFVCVFFILWNSKCTKGLVVDQEVVGLIHTSVDRSAFWSKAVSQNLHSMLMAEFYLYYHVITFHLVIFCDKMAYKTCALAELWVFFDIFRLSSLTNYFKHDFCFQKDWNIILISSDNFCVISVTVKQALVLSSALPLFVFVLCGFGFFL